MDEIDRAAVCIFNARQLYLIHMPEGMRRL